jgi:hypothetical protein
MGKRSDFTRRKADAYHTIDFRAAKALQPFIEDIDVYAEPCVGNFDLVKQLAKIGKRVDYVGDIEMGLDAFDVRKWGGARAIITNPPWTRKLLHPLIMHFMHQLPTWLLFDSDWAYNKSSAPYLPYCSDIVAVGRLRWIEGTTQTGKDNVSWYRFWHNHYGPTRFHGRGNHAGHTMALPRRTNGPRQPDDRQPSA